MKVAWLLPLVLLPFAAALAPTVRVHHVAGAGDWTGKPPSLADVNGDGLLDFVGQNADRGVYAIDPRSGAILARVEPSYPYGPDLGPFNGPKAADLDGDGVVELVNVNRAATLSVWRMQRQDGALAPALAWERHLAEHHAQPSADAGPVLGDLDGDGALDIVVQTEEQGAYALRADGSTLWSLPHYGGNAEPRIRDVDADGDLDVVFFTDGGVVRAVEGRDGETLWQFDATHHGAWPASITSPGVVDDIDGDGRVEVVVCARNVENGTPEYAPRPLSQHHLMLFALRDGALLWKAKPAWANPLCAAYLVAFDADGNGKKEIYGVDWNTIGHKPGSWERADATHAFAFLHDGTQLWHREVHPWNAKANVAAADWTGDGKTDLIVYDASGLAILDAATGNRVASVDLGGEPIQGPLVADLDADGDADAIAAVGARLLVADSGAPLVSGGWPGWDAIAPGTGPPVIPSPSPPTPSPPPAATGQPTTSPPIDARAEIPEAPHGASCALILVAAARALRASSRAARGAACSP